MKEIFTEIYKHNLWGSPESVSGPGSSIHESRELMIHLPLLFELFDIGSILDAPCGDFNWMKHVPKHHLIYTGLDIVDELINENAEKYGNETTRFLVRNIITDDLPAADLIICRDCLVHLPHALVKKAIKNFKDSGCKYLLTTHFPFLTDNSDIPTGSWRPLNLCLAPFHFPEPILMIKETTSVKTMALWKLSNL